MMRNNMANAPRMSLSALNMSDDPDRQVRIWLLGSTTIKGTVFYRIAGRFSSSGQTWQVNRRYSEFLVLRDTLVKYFSRTTDTCPGCLNYLHSIQQFDFPKKHLFVSKSQLVVNYRTQALRSFMNLLASWTFSNSPKCPTCGGFAFDIVRNFCLESAEAVGDSNMSYIRESFQVSTFTEAGRRSSLTRRNSLTPGFSSHTPNAHRRDQQRVSDQRNTLSGPQPDQRRGREEGAYDAFNDYLVRQPSQQSKAMQARSNINIPQRRQSEDEHDQGPTTSGSSRGSSRGSRAPPLQRASSTPQTQQPSTSMTNGSFLFYQDGGDHGDSTRSSQRGISANGGGSANGSGSGPQRGAPPPSSGNKRGILKNWDDVQRDRAQPSKDVPRDRTQNDSYFSLGASSDAASLEALEQPANATGRPSSSRSAPRKTRSNDARSENSSYFSLGASSGHSRDGEEREYARPSSKPKQNAHQYNPVDHEQRLREARYDRSQNDSYLSLGASSTGDLEEEYHSHHPSVLPSPGGHEAVYLHPPPTQKYIGKQQVRSPPPPSSQRKSHQARSPPPPSQRKSQRARSPPPPPSQEYEEEDEQPRSSRRHRQPQPQSQPQQQQQPRSHKKAQPILAESFATDDFVDDSLRFDGMGPIAFVNDVSDSDDDEIDVTGLVIDSPPKPRKSKSGQDLWQPWELAKAG